MPKPRNKENINLPKRWQYRYGAYYYRVPQGQEKYYKGKTMVLLGKDLESSMGEFNKIQQEEPIQYDHSLIPLSEIKNKKLSENFSFIYFLFQGDELQYIGQSKNPITRLSAHKARKIISFDSVSILEANKKDVHSLEQEYIRKHKPKHNTDWTNDWEDFQDLGGQ